MRGEGNCGQNRKLEAEIMEQFERRHHGNTLPKGRGSFGFHHPNNVTEKHRAQRRGAGQTMRHALAKVLRVAKKNTMLDGGAADCCDAGTFQS